MMRSSRNWTDIRGFTLVELSVVLVILGLLTGGAVVGRSLIKSSELRSVGVQYTEYKTAVHAFTDKYFALPGDMPNAVSYWGAAAGGTANGYDATCAALTTPSTGTATCNGDGDGHIGNHMPDRQYESYRSWQHLANAGLITGNFDGVGNSDVSYATRTNSWPSKLGRDAIFVIWWQQSVYSTMYPHLYWGNGEDLGHVLFLRHPGHLYTTTEDVLSPLEAYNIDVKFDDGKPAYGIIRSYHNDSTNCITVANDPTASWNIQFDDPRCLLIMQTGF